jgi:hypothetical protein
MTSAILSAEPRGITRRPGRRFRQETLAFLLLAAAQGLGGCDQRTAIAITLVAPPAAVDLDKLDLLVLDRDAVVECRTYPLVRPTSSGQGGSFVTRADGNREARLLYYPPAGHEAATLGLEAAVYALADASPGGGRGGTQVTLTPHQLNTAQINLRAASLVGKGLCFYVPDLAVEDLSAPPDLASIPDLTSGPDLAASDMANTQQRDLVSEGPDMTKLDDLGDPTMSDATFPIDQGIVDALPPPYDASATDLAVSSPPDQSIIDQGSYVDLATTDGAISPLELGTSTLELGTTNLCDDGNPCTNDFTIPLGGGNYTCQFQPATAGTICRPANGPCDVAEVCDGRGSPCPPDSAAALCNGNFDADPGGLPWVLLGLYNRVTFNDSPCQARSQPNYDVFCGAPGCRDLTSQTISIPPGRGAQVVFWLSVLPDRFVSSSTNDFFAELLEDQIVRSQLGLSSGKVTASGYQQYVLNIPPSLLPLRLLQFRTQTGPDYVATFCLDDVSVIVN